jgi:CHAD domain-containing protein
MRPMPARPFESTVRALREEMLRYEPEVRTGVDPEAAHKQRVATRRLRSLLRSARTQIDDRERSEHLREELRWLGAALGEVRDRDVLIAYLLGELETVEEAAAFGAALELLDEEREVARGELLEALDSERYQTLLQELERPPALEDGDLRSAATKEHRRLAKTVARLDGEPSDEELHKVRIRVKRARYAAEACGGSKRYVKRAKALQDILGEHQDAVVAEARIRDLVGRLHGTGRTALAAGRLIERQRSRRLEERQAWKKAWKRLERAGDADWR